MLSGFRRSLDVPLLVLGASAVRVEVDDPDRVPATLDRAVLTEVGDPAANDRSAALDCEDVLPGLESLAGDASGKPALGDPVAAPERAREAAPRFIPRPRVIDRVLAEQVGDRDGVARAPGSVVSLDPAENPVPLHDARS